MPKGFVKLGKKTAAGNVVRVDDAHENAKNESAHASHKVTAGAGATVSADSAAE
jgi:hypothetical protein